MSNFSDSNPNGITRRAFILNASVAGFCLLNCETSAQQTVPAEGPRCLDDETVTPGKVSFKRGTGVIDAYLARPKKKGRYPIVIVVTGSSIDDEYVRNLTAMLAQGDLVGIAPNIFSLQKDTMTLDEK